MFRGQSVTQWTWSWILLQLRFRKQPCFFYRFLVLSFSTRLFCSLGEFCELLISRAEISQVSSNNDFLPRRCAGCINTAVASDLARCWLSVLTLRNKLASLRMVFERRVKYQVNVLSPTTLPRAWIHQRPSYESKRQLLWISTRAVLQVALLYFSISYRSRSQCNKFLDSYFS